VVKSRACVERVGYANSSGGSAPSDVDICMENSRPYLLYAACVSIKPWQHIRLEADDAYNGTVPR
jgi:hypothetical protein